jgi:hypothetical protein
VDFLALSSIVTYTFASATILLVIWRRDVFFAVFMTLLVLYSIVTQWSYFFLPEISNLLVKMYFGVEPLTKASIFSTLSMIALLLGYSYIYCPITKSKLIRMHHTRRNPVIFILVSFICASLLIVGYFYYRENLSYQNSSDDQLLAQLGKLYTAFIQIYKFSALTILVMYAVLRKSIMRSLTGSFLTLVLLLTTVFFFMVTTIGLGNRIDALSLVFGIMGFEYFNAINNAEKAEKAVHAKLFLPKNTTKTSSTRIWLVLIAFLVLALLLLTILQQARADRHGLLDQIGLSPLLEIIIVNDYFAPFHLLIGAMAINYIDPLSVLLSNFANSLMFLNVDFIQFYVVNHWNPGSVTRTASPAFFVFTEGFIFLGWLGFIYNGIVCSMGIALWRLFSITSDKGFNAMAFSITVAVATTVPRSQSSYFIKNVYLSFLPALAIYCLAAGLTPINLFGVSQIRNKSTK